MGARSPLVIYHKQLGDVLLLEPALAKLSAACGQSVALATRPAFASMVSLMDQVHIAESGLFRRASEVISFGPRPHACLIALSTCAPRKRLVTLREEHLRPWHRLCFPTERRVVPVSGIYRAEYFFQAMPVESNMAFRPPRLRQPPAEWLPGGLPEKYILIHATSAWPEKSWVAQAWARTIDELQRQGMGPFVITGGNAEWEREHVDAIQRACSVSLINLCGKTSLSGYMAVVANARLLLCVDGSSSHLATAFGVPALTLFGPSSRKGWHHASTTSIALDARDFSDRSSPSMADIPVEPVLAHALVLRSLS